jgi:hypothetical protein
MNSIKLTCSILAIGLIPAVSSAATVSTAFGTGADLEIREHSNSVNNGTSMNTRTSSGGDRNEIVGLAFDLSGYTLADLTSISLNLISFRADSSTRVVDLYGITQGVSGGTGAFTTETWDESISLFGDMPGLDLTDGNYLTQSINMGSVTHLGQFTIASGQPEGSVQVLASAALNSFIQSYSGSTRVSFLLAAGNNSTGQFRIASREATQTATGVLTGSAGDFAPYLSFTVVPEPSTAALACLGLLGMAMARRRR